MIHFETAILLINKIAFAFLIVDKKKNAFIWKVKKL